MSADIAQEPDYSTGYSTGEGTGYSTGEGKEIVLLGLEEDSRSTAQTIKLSSNDLKLIEGLTLCQPISFVAR